jgi:transglutaminase-like putative cysteine protease
MKLRIEHTTIFSYDSPISEAYTEMRLAPLALSSQHRTQLRLQTNPGKEITRFYDRYQNEVHYFDVLQSHQQLTVTATSEVLTSAIFSEEKSDISPLDRFDFLMLTSYVEPSEYIKDLAQSCLQPDNEQATVMSLAQRIHQTIAYEKGATSVKTTAREAIALGKGVCQDYAHVMIAAARSINFPARYVSGYLYSPNAPEMASHAWVDVWTSGKGWMAIDPTHNCLQGEEHVRVATGRDYADVPPTRGVYKGNAKETMQIQVTVEKV